MEDFREWSASALKSAFDYSKASNETIRNLIEGGLGFPTMNKKVLVFKGYVFTKDIPCEAPPNKKPTVGMRKGWLVRTEGAPDKFDTPTNRLRLVGKGKLNRHSPQESSGCPVHTDSAASSAPPPSSSMGHISHSRCEASRTEETLSPRSDSPCSEESSVFRRGGPRRRLVLSHQLQSPPEGGNSDSDNIICRCDLSYFPG